jgi:hypothetical protein
LQPAAGEKNPLGGKNKFISRLGGNISYFKAARTSDASHEMEGVVIAEHKHRVLGKNLNLLDIRKLASPPMSIDRET